MDLRQEAAKVGEMTLVPWQDRAQARIEVALEDLQAVRHILNSAGSSRS